MKKIITSESVNCGHPDKTCDIIADSFLDAALSQDKNCQMAVECAIKDDLLMIYGESTTTAKIDYEKIAKDTLKEIGYENEFRVVKTISSQSPDINQAVVKDELCANDQGIMFGYATNESENYMPLPITISHELMFVYDKYRRENKNKYFADAKSQVSVEYEYNKPVAIDTVLLSVSHSENVEHDEILKDMMENVVNPVLEKYKHLNQENIKFIINPSGKFTIWGCFSDSGCVGRKIVVDTYGGVDGALEAVLIELGNHAGVVDVGVGQEHRLDHAGTDGQGDILEHVGALLHAAVHHVILTAHFQQRTAAGDLMGSADKLNFHC